VTLRLSPVTNTTLSPNLIWASNSGDGGVTRIIDDGKSNDGGDDNATPNDHGKSKLKGTHTATGCLAANITLGQQLFLPGKEFVAQLGQHG
jgi:hypothetical protein